MAIKRHYFAKAIAPPPPRMPRPQHTGQKVVVQLPNGQTRITSSAKWARLQGSVKGAATLHARGLAHRWTSEEARAAALKSWKHKGRFIHRIGRRIGRASKRGLGRADLKTGVVVQVLQTGRKTRVEE